MVLKFSIKNIYLFASVLLIFGFAVLLRIPYLRVPVLVVDESLYAEVANTILEGRLPYKDAWDQKPPGIYYLYALIFALFGKNNLYAVHIACAIFVALSAILIFFILRLLKNNVAGLIGALSYSVLASAGQASQFQAANTEIFSMLFVLISLFLFLKSDNKSVYLFFSGFSLATGMAFKQPAILAIFPMFLLLFLQNGKKKQASLSSIYLISGLIPVTGFVFLYFFFNDALYDFYIICIIQNFVYMDANNLAHGFNAALRNIPFFIGSNYLFYITSAIAFFCFSYKLIADIINKTTLNYISFFLCAWYAISWISVSLGGRFEGHYFFFVFPAIAVFSSFFWIEICKYLRRKCKFAVIVPALIFVIATGYSVYIHCGFPPGTKKIYFTVIDPENPKGEPIRRTAQYIAQNTAKTGRIFVWGLCPEIYTLSNRRCAGRFIYANYLIGMMTGDRYFYSNTERLDRTVSGSWDKLIDDLTKYKPVFIIDTSPSNYFQYAKYPISRFVLLDSFIKRYYLFDRRIGNIDIYRRR